VSQVTLSVIMPVLNEAAEIGPGLEALSPLRRRGVEVIVVDGGSTDGTFGLAHPFADRALTAPRGRAWQMNAGAEVAKGDVLLFLHADTRLPADADRLIEASLAQTGSHWGRFDVCIPGGRVLALVAKAMNLRSRVTGIATGDQAIFLTRAAFAAIDGVPPIALMEDIALSKRLRRLGPPLCLREQVFTSSRRWQKHGVVKTVLLMWRLRLAFFFGANPANLSRAYGYDAETGAAG
jgi:rSAM/selenodomain-associated transferase 2